MSLDIYVMPLWRFHAGLFESPLERAFGGDHVTVVSILGERAREAPSKLRARLYIWRLCRAVKAKSGCQASWIDEGEVVYGEQAWFGFEQLRAFALWTGVRDVMPAFDKPEGDNYYKHPVWALTKGKSQQYPQLIDHSCHTGYLLPVDFQPVCHVFPKKFHIWTFYTSVGSSPRLLKELQLLRPHLGESLEFDPEDPLSEVKQSYLQLLEVTQSSIRHGLPVIFNG